MVITICWESPSWSCYVQKEDGKRFKAETPTDLCATDGYSMERWARRQWPQASVVFDEYLV
jgi:hypothetical protein